MRGGNDSGKLYAYSTLKAKVGLHFAAGINKGYSNYSGPVHQFDFDETFGGKSYGVEGDYLFGVSANVSQTDQYGNELISTDVGYGPGLGGSGHISETYLTPLIDLW